MSQQSAYIRYRSSPALYDVVQRYTDEMDRADPQPELEVLLQAMELFVQESVATFVLQPAGHVGLKPGLLKMINSLSKLTEKSAMMLVNKVAKKMTVDDHRNAAAYMKQVRLSFEEDGQVVGDIIFPIRSDFAELGWITREKMLNGYASDPAVVQQGIDFLHEVIDVANLWVFEKPVEILNLGPVMRKLATGTVSTVKKTTHSLINTIVPKISEQQIIAAAEYFSDIVGPGPFFKDYGEIPESILAMRMARVAMA